MRREIDRQTLALPIAVPRLRKLVLRALAICLAPVVLYWVLGLIVYRWVMPPLTPLMVIRSVELGHVAHYEPRPIDAVSPALAVAVVAAEDSHFCLHHGVDISAVEDAVQDYSESGRLRGASTITMQVARNVFLWPGGGALRKAIEIPLALAIDALWPKRRIVEVYLNIAEWGPGVFGAEAAAHFHFGVPAKSLSTLQAARFAAVLPNPRHWSASKPSDYVRSRSQVILRESGRLGGVYVACLR